ncbi:hypothetical protein [Emticicia sp. TH156]|uniref:hypothetical protein n=1 Tax=Emticicia sp. TH156 TaxID=2067454 RepID=UPI000C77C128|nr:hypothetical protein [Emticicia sp. TH156]PLK44975.1 hypothetical protein C0V77_06935 [Emticicia sp. TH156]
MKKSNLMLLIFLMMFVAGTLITNQLLVAQYHKINLHDRYKNFHPIAAQAFRVLDIRGGNSYSVKIVKGPAYGVMLMNSRKQFFSLQQNKDTTVILFTVANQQYQAPEQCTTGLIVTVPMLESLSTSGINCEIDGLQQLSLSLHLSEGSTMRLRSLKINQMSIYGTGASTAFFKDKNESDTLRLTLQKASSVDLGKTFTKAIYPILKDNSRLTLTNTTVKKIY